MTSLPPPDVAPAPEAPRPATGAPAAERRGAGGWPPWIGPAALISAFAAITIFGGIIIFAWNSDGGDIPPGALQLTTYLQDAFFVAAALLFAGFTSRPVAADFGLLPTRFWRALGLTIAVGVGFYVLSAIWIAAIGAEAEDDVSDLGVEDTTLLLVTGAVLLTVLAPLCEEILFRGLVFRALRNWQNMWPAAIMTGVLFGLIHAGSSPIAFLVPLAFFGTGLCLLYEKTGSLYPCIALHAANNTLAFGVLVEWDWQIPPAMVAAVLAALGIARLLARFVGDGRAALPAGAG